jgi:hypothetical protein
MDIMLPRLEQQVSPPPRLIARREIDIPYLIRKRLRESPHSGVDEIVEWLAELNIQASGLIVAMWLMKERNSEVAKATASKVAVGARRSGKTSRVLVAAPHEELQHVRA